MHDDYNFRYYIDIFNFKIVFTYNNVFPLMSNITRNDVKMVDQCQNVK